MTAKKNGAGSGPIRAEHIVASASAAVGDVRSAKQALSARFITPRAAAAAAGFRAPAASRPDQNVVGVGVAEKVVDGKPTGVLCVKLFVRVKYPQAHLTTGELLPDRIDGIPTDVEEVGVFRKLPALRTPSRRRPAGKPTRKPTRKQAGGAASVTVPNPRERIRPAQPGCSVGFEIAGGGSVMAGTFGAVVRRDGQTFILSNNHVLADENRLPLGSPIHQPGTLDGGNPAADGIATLTDFVPLQLGVSNTVDAAIARVVPASRVSRDVLHIGAPQGPGRALRDMIVHKFGRTTDYTAGRITSVETDVSVEYETGVYAFADQIIIHGLNGTMFSDSGDSGSLILERGTQRAIGLLFAGSPTYTIANHLEDVLGEFGGITLA